MWKTTFIVLFLLLHDMFVFCHDAKRLSTLDKKFRRKIYWVRTNLMDELSDREEKIKSDIRLELPQVIEETILDLLSSGELDRRWRVKHGIGLQKQHQQIQQLKTIVLGLSRRLAESDNELMAVHQEIQKLRSEMITIDETSSGNVDYDITSVRREMLKLQNDMKVMKEVVSKKEENDINSVQRELMKVQNDMTFLNETFTKKKDNDIIVVRREILKLRNDMDTMNETISKTGICPARENGGKTNIPTERKHENSISETVIALGKNGRGFVLDPNKHDQRRLIDIPISVQAFTVLKDKTSLTLVVSGVNSYLKKMRFVIQNSSLQLEQNVDFEPAPAGTCYSMAYDEINKSFFFGVSTYEPRHKIKRTISNRIHQVADVSKHGHAAYSLAVDPQKELIFSCHFIQLLRLSYSGRKERVIAFGTFLLAVTLSSSADYVYYSDGGAIMRVSTDGEGKRLMRTLKHSVNIRSIILAGEKIYAGDFAGEITVYDLKLNKSETLGVLPTSYVVLNSLA